MFRAEINQLANGPTLKMEGRLVGDWAEQAKCLVTKQAVPPGLIVDLTEVMYVDRVGEEVLNWLKSIGAKFVADGIYSTSICERLRLPRGATTKASSKTTGSREHSEALPKQGRTS